MDDDTVLDLEVDVNGEEVFMVNKRILSRHSRRIEALLCKSKSGPIRTKVIFNDFPGGAASFELVTRFCYNGGKTDINPYSISRLTLAAHFLEMNKLSSENENLCEQTEKSFKEVSCWTWSELMAALKHCQDLQQNTSSSVTILDKFLEFIVERIILCSETSSSPSISSSDGSVFRLSCDSASVESPGNGKASPKATWWFKDLVVLNTDSVKTLVRRLMVSRNFDSSMISRFLLYYQKSKFNSVSTAEEKIKIVDMVVEMLHSLDVESIPYKSLFRMLRVARNINSSQSCKDKLENMIGLQLDQSTLDDLLIPCEVRASYLYDVNLILRLLKSFIGKGVCHVPLSRLKKVSSLLDSYLAEVAPDPHLKPSKFLALIRALTDSARQSEDGVYFAISIYLKVHSGLSEEQRLKICFELSYEKLSSEAFDHLMQNTNFPSEIHVRALMSRQRKLKSLLRDTNQPTLVDDAVDKVRKEEFSDQIVLYAKKFNLTDENEKLKARLQGMQWRVAELEKVCRKMQIQMANMMRSRLSSQNKAKSVPRLCS